MVSAFLRYAFLAAVGLALVTGPALGEEDSMKTAVGEKAPDFELKGSDGKMHSLSDHLGQRAVVIAWFPKAFTGG